MSRVRPEYQSKSIEEPLFLSDQELVALFGCGQKKARAFIRVLEREGRPPPDPVIGKRYFPAVKRFLDCRHGLEPLSRPPLTPDGKEEWDDGEN